VLPDGRDDPAPTKGSGWSSNNPGSRIFNLPIAGAAHASRPSGSARPAQISLSVLASWFDASFIPRQLFCLSLNHTPSRLVKN
jgi:hypothetical protein